MLNFIAQLEFDFERKAINNLLITIISVIRNDKSTVIIIHDAYRIYQIPRYVLL